MNKQAQDLKGYLERIMASENLSITKLAKHTGICRPTITAFLKEKHVSYLTMLKIEKFVRDKQSYNGIPL